MSALLIAALGLGSWQLADALMDQGDKSDDTNTTQTQDGGDKNQKKPVSGKPIAIKGARDFDPFGPDGSEKPRDIGKAYDNDTASYWQTDFYLSPEFGNLKSGVGIILDLGKVQQVGKVTVSFGARPRSNSGPRPPTRGRSRRRSTRTARSPTARAPRWFSSPARRSRASTSCLADQAAGGRRRPLARPGGGRQGDQLRSGKGVVFLFGDGEENHPFHHRALDQRPLTVPRGKQKLLPLREGPGRER